MEMDWRSDLHLGWGKRERDDEGTSLDEDAGEDAIPDDGSCCPILQRKHKIFLSHSGTQKWFVEKLCEDLEARHRFPFFDKRASSLPKGERFPKLILAAAEQCEMAVVVVSEEFLTSKWPMIELRTFVGALSGSNPGLRILPLFFEMSVSDLRSASRQDAWLKVWSEWAREDPKIKLGEFEEALKMLRSFNGMVFDGDMNIVWNYERDVVESICRVIGADVKWEDSHVQGRSSICEATRGKMKEIKPSENGICVFGYYGVGGMGKTTMCKTLCNELSNEFLGKVCHVELLGTRSAEQMLKEVLRKLTNTSEEELQRFDEGQCRNILKKCSSWTQRTFLAIDNVWDDDKSMKQAEMFLDEPAFHEGSVVMVTSRCRPTLMRVGIEESHCFEVPELGEVDARKLFLHHFARGKQFANERENVVINQCIARCWFQKNKAHGHYLPLALMVLGVHLRRCGPSPVEWLGGLPKVRDFNNFVEENPVFSIIRLSYDRLSVQLQVLFMDVAYFFHWSWWFEGSELDDHCYFSWLSLLHHQQLQETKSQLLQLKERGLLEDVSMESEQVSVHDLYKEFAEMEAKGKLDSSVGLNNRKWAIYEGSYPLELERTPSGRCWENLIRMRVLINECPEVVFHRQGIQWRYFSNLVMLSLCVHVEVRGVLNLAGLRCLKSLELCFHFGSDGVDGLNNLKNLVFFSWSEGAIEDSNKESAHLEQYPTSLGVLNLEGCEKYERDVYTSNVYLGNNLFDRCKNLLELTLHALRSSGCIDLRQCTSLKDVSLYDIDGLHTLLVPSKGTCLQSLWIQNCEDLTSVSGLGDSYRLNRLDIQCGRSLEVPNLKALKHLRHLTFRWLYQLTVLEGVESLKALTYISLGGCSSLSRLPNLSNSSNLEWLDIWGTGIELHEEDVDVLATLPRLSRVRIFFCSNWEGFLLNPVRRKVLHFNDISSERRVEERDLVLPIHLQNRPF